MKPGIYRHHKGGLYTVLMTAFDATNSADRDEMVVYVSHTTGGVFVRKRTEFEGKTWCEGKLQPRFTFVGEYTRPVKAGNVEAGQ